MSRKSSFASTAMTGSSINPRSLIMDGPYWMLKDIYGLESKTKTELGDGKGGKFTW